MDLFEANPSGQPRGGVIVLQEAFGLTDYIQEVCRGFADNGYVAVAPHLFHRVGDPVLEYADVHKIGPLLAALTLEGLEADLAATLGHLSDRGLAAARTGVVGFCMGGSVSLLAGARHQLGGAVTFYGGGITAGRFGIPPLLELVAELQTPCLGLYGDQDAAIPVDQVEQLASALRATDQPTDLVRYVDAGHGFHCDGRDSYHRPSAEDAWKRTLDWLEAHLS